jgi:hypothetical protein
MLTKELGLSLGNLDPLLSSKKRLGLRAVACDLFPDDHMAILG